MSRPALRIGLVGAGGIAHAHLPNLLKLGEVVVHSTAGAPELVAAFGGQVAHSLPDLLDRVDVVDVAVPTFAHAEIVRAALAAGKPVISEKPLALTDADAADLAARAESAGLPLYPAHVVRFFPEYVRLKEAVDAGTLGDLAVLRFSRSGAFPTRTKWFADHALSGGIIMDQMIHDLDMARWIAGDVVRVSAVTARIPDDENPVEAAHVLLTHASGAISHVAGLWGPQHLAFSTEYSVTGTRGSLAHSSPVERDYRADLAASGTSDGYLPQIDPAEDPYYLELREFLRAIQGGPAPRVTAADGVAAVSLANAALRSLETGQPVEVPSLSGVVA